MSAPIQYTRSGEVNIAYQVTGGGPLRPRARPGFFSHLEIYWEHPELARFLERLGSVARLIRFDKRGTGLSDRSVGLPDFETRMDDVRAVMDAVGASERRSSATPRAGRCAFCSRPHIRNGPSTHPAWHVREADPKRRLPLGSDLGGASRRRGSSRESWGENVDVSTMIPNADPAEIEWFHRAGRASLSPAGGS